MDIFDFLNKYKRNCIHYGFTNGKLNGNRIKVFYIYIKESSYNDNNLTEFPKYKFRFWKNLLKLRFDYFSIKEGWHNDLSKIPICKNNNEKIKLLEWDKRRITYMSTYFQDFGEECDRFDFPFLHHGNVWHSFYYDATNIDKLDLISYERIIFQNDFKHFLQNELNYYLISEKNTFKDNLDVIMFKTKLPVSKDYKDSLDYKNYKEVMKKIPTHKICEFSRRFVVDKYKYPNCTIDGMPVTLYMGLNNFEVRDNYNPDNVYCLMCQSLEITKKLLHVKNDIDLFEHKDLTYFANNTLKKIIAIKKFENYDKNFIDKYPFPLLIKTDTIKRNLTDSFIKDNEEFNECIVWLFKNNNKVDTSTKLKLYGIYKQIKCGDINIKKPSICSFQERKKWYAWNACKGIKRGDAIKCYIDIVKNMMFLNY